MNFGVHKIRVASITGLSRQDAASRVSLWRQHMRNAAEATDCVELDRNARCCDKTLASQSSRVAGDVVAQLLGVKVRLRVGADEVWSVPVSYTHLRAHETLMNL
eukprot:1829773-Prymnesium_polylepis.2